MQEKNEKASSIEVSRNAKGEHSFKVKIYYDDETTKEADVINKIEKAYVVLHEKFK